MQWTPPETLPSRADLTTALGILEAQAEPATRKHIAWCLSKLSMAFEPSVKLSDEDTQFRASIWLESCGDLGDELWSKATLAAIQSSKWMPKPAEFRKLVEREIGDRQKRIGRVRDMLAATNAEMPSAPKPKPMLSTTPEALIARRRKELAEQEARTDWASEGDKIFSLAHTHRSLAFLSKQPMPEWVWDYFDERAQRPGAKEHTFTKAAAAAPKVWQAGQPTYSPEEPPPPDEVAEGGEHLIDTEAA